MAPLQPLQMALFHLLIILYLLLRSLVFCTSLLDEGGCVIRYGQDLSYQDLGPPHTGPPQLLLPPTPHGGHYNLLLPGHHQLLPHHSVERELDQWRM